MIVNLEEYIQKALAEAHKQRINANTVFLNSEIALVKRSYEKIGNTVQEFPPMICGLTCFLSDELPDNIPFAVCETKAETEFEKGRREGRQELIQELKEMQLGEILDLINSEPI